MSRVMTFGSWLKQRRRELGFTQDELSERIGCSVFTLRKLEAGARRPSGQIAQLLADYLHVRHEEREAFIAFARTGMPSSALVTLGSSNEGAGQYAVHVPWRSSHLSRTNLPALLTTLVGREAEVTAARDILLQPKVRLLTLTGPPGIGKTRLALQLASDLVEHFENGAFLVELAPITDPDLVLATVARTLGLKETTSQPVEDALLDFLREKRMLLFLDNFEQVLDAAIDVAELLSACPQLKALVTSREALRVAGEQQFHVPPLGLPDPARNSDWQAALTYPAISLFAQRAKASVPEFAITPNNAEAVAAICARLEGLPLAIELAAARVNLLSPQEIEAHLHESSLRLLASRARHLPTKQRTLRGAIDWSYNLLDEAEQRLFRRLGVFVGGCTLAAVEAVCDVDGDLAIDALEGIASLVEKNLLKHEEVVRYESRYTMLETVRQYAGEKLAESGEAETLQRQHALYLMRLAEQAEPHLRGEQQEEWLTRLEQEYDNIRAALRWTSEQSQISRGFGGAGASETAEIKRKDALEIGLRLAAALLGFWRVLGYFGEGREQLTRLLGGVTVQSTQKARPNLSPDSRDQPAPSMCVSPSAIAECVTKAVYSAGLLALDQGDYSAARSLLEQSLTLWRDLGDKRGIAKALSSLGNVANEQGDYPLARSLHEEGLALRREVGSKIDVAISITNLASVLKEQREFDSACSLFEEGLALSRESGDSWGMGFSLLSLGSLAYLQGDHSAARPLIEEALALFRQMRGTRGIGFTLNALGNLAVETKDYSSARSLYEESLIILRQQGDKLGIAASLIGLGSVALGGATVIGSQGNEESTRRAEVARGVRLLGAAEALYETIGAVPWLQHRIPYERGIAIARAQMEEQAFRGLWEEGRAMGLEQAIECALESG
jgi:predicted ATPase/transcriptional regulator with XRE-family HTH domain